MAESDNKEIDVKELTKYKNIFRREGHDVKASRSQDVLQKTKEMMVIYKMFSVKRKKIRLMNAIQVEKALKYFRRGICHRAKCRKIEMVEV